MSDWPIENIPNADHLFMRVHKQYLKGHEVTPGAFQSREAGMSVEPAASTPAARRRQRSFSGSSR